MPISITNIRKILCVFQNHRKVGCVYVDADVVFVSFMYNADHKNCNSQLNMTHNFNIVLIIKVIMGTYLCQYSFKYHKHTCVMITTLFAHNTFKKLYMFLTLILFIGKTLGIIIVK